MLAREIIEDSLLSFIAKEDSNVEADGDIVNQKVILRITICPTS